MIKGELKTRNIPIRRTDVEKTQVGDYYDGVDRYFDHNSEKVVVKLMSGDCYATADRNEMIVTILGSCIAACVRDPITNVGGMNHFLLPGDFESSALNESARYGTFAMEKLINQILNLGGKKDRLEIKIFGGANVIENSSMIGQKNVNFIKNFLKADGFTIASEHVGGTAPRRIHYYPDSGKVMMRLLKRKEDMKVVQKEEVFRSSLRKNPLEGEIELF